jgi:predicted enzyme related to lactoylglutathione lyase
MLTQSIGLVWIVVKDFQKAVSFYTEIAGLKIVEKNDEWGWAELEGHEGTGMRLGIARQCEGCEPIQPGHNGVVTFKVGNIEEACKDLKAKGASLVGEIVEVPGHVKMQTVCDADGNHFQVVEVLSEVCPSDQQSKGSCCGH